MVWYNILWFHARWRKQNECNIILLEYIKLKLEWDWNKWYKRILGYNVS